MKEIVEKIDPYTDRHNVLCTTYQMRNFYQQLHDGFFSVLDIMNYIQHHTVVKLARSSDRVLDICCGRGLLLPLLRYHKRSISSYTGVDIKKSNAIFRTKRVTDHKPLSDDYYPFDVFFAESDVAEMSKVLPHDHYTFLVYTASIEHMHPDHGKQSLYEARTVAMKGARLFLTCPNTPEDQDGYDTQYAAHVYEWKQSEIRAGLAETGWALSDVYGLLATTEVLEQTLKPDVLEAYRRLKEYIPSEWLNPIFAPLVPDYAKEIAYVAYAS